MLTTMKPQFDVKISSSVFFKYWKSSILPVFAKVSIFRKIVAFSMY